MAAITIIGVLERIRFLPNQNGCLVFVSEYKRGYKRKDGVRVEDKVNQWKIIFKQGLVNYISDHFSNGMLVEVKGDALPFAVVNDQIVEGYSIMGQTLNMFSVPRPSAILEKRAIRESQQSSSGTPDVESFDEPDF